MEKIKILVVDDEEMIYEFLEEKLTDIGYEVRLAFNGEEALKQTYKENPDIIILDIKMPKKNGIEVLRTLKGQNTTKDIYIIMNTIRGTQEDIDMAKSLNANAYVCKPSRFKNLKSEILKAEKFLMVTRRD